MVAEAYGDPVAYLCHPLLHTLLRLKPAQILAFLPTATTATAFSYMSVKLGGKFLSIRHRHKHWSTWVTKIKKRGCGEVIRKHPVTLCPVAQIADSLYFSMS